MKKAAVSRPWLTLAFAVAALCACGGGGGGGGGGSTAPAPAPGSGDPPAPPPPPAPTPPTEPSPFKGNYDVAYQGAQQGNCSVQISVAGDVSGSCVNGAGTALTLTGTVSSAGNFGSELKQASGVVSTVASFSGTLLNDGTGAGTWAGVDVSTGFQGSWTLKRPSVTVTSRPSLTAAQAGSLAEAGGMHGVWRRRLDEKTDVGYEPLILSADSRFYLAQSALIARGDFESELDAAGDYQMKPGAYALETPLTGVVPSPEPAFSVSGSFRVTGRTSLGLTCKKAGDDKDLCDYSILRDSQSPDAGYDALNALAVGLADMAGEWTGSLAPSVSVDPSGQVTVTTVGETYGACQLTGTLTQLTGAAGSRYNLFSVQFPAGSVTRLAATCNLLGEDSVQTSAYTGYAFLRVVNMGTAAEPYYKHRLELFASQELGSSPSPKSIRLLSVRK